MGARRRHQKQTQRLAGCELRKGVTGSLWSGMSMRDRTKCPGLLGAKGLYVPFGGRPGSLWEALVYPGPKKAVYGNHPFGPCVMVRVRGSSYKRSLLASLPDMCCTPMIYGKISLRTHHSGLV